MNIRIKRVTAPSSARPTFGVIYDEKDTPFAVTLEREWRNNQKGESCIPVGTYTCQRVTSPKFGNTFEVTGVPGRSAILFHAGNLQSDSHGCIILGESYETIGSEAGVAQSKKALDEFFKLTKDVDEFTLVVQQT